MKKISLIVLGISALLFASLIQPSYGSETSGEQVIPPYIFPSTDNDVILP